MRQLNVDPGQDGQVALRCTILQARALAAPACELGRIQADGHPSKASREVPVSGLSQVKTNSGVSPAEVLVLSKLQGPAAVARTLCRETDANGESRLKLLEERRAMPRFEVLRAGRPSKRDRRVIERLQDRT